MFTLLLWCLPYYTDVFPTALLFSLLLCCFPYYSVVFPATLLFSLLLCSYSHNFYTTLILSMLFPYFLFHSDTFFLTLTLSIIHWCIDYVHPIIQRQWHALWYNILSISNACFYSMIDTIIFNITQILYKLLKCLINNTFQDWSFPLVRSWQLPWKKHLLWTIKLYFSKPC